MQGQSRNFKPFVSHRVREIHDESSPDQWRYVPTKRNPADQGTRGAFVQELVTDDCWCHGPSFLQGGEDEWPQRKFEKAPEAYEEVKSEKRGQFERNEPSNNAQSYYVETVKSKSEPDPTDYSKWYGIQSEGKIEIGISLVRVTGWINRFLQFLANVRKHQNGRVRGELTPRELRQAEAQIIKTTQQQCFPDEIQALKDNKPLTKKSTLLKITPKLYGGLVRSNTRLRYSDDLPEETKFPIILQKNHIVTNGGSRNGSELYIESFARKVFGCSRTTASKEMYQGRCGMQQAIQGLSRKTADGTITQNSIRDDSETVYQSCNRFRRTFLHNARTRQTKDEALLMPILTIAPDSFHPQD